MVPSTALMMEITFQLRPFALIYFGCNSELLMDKSIKKKKQLNHVNNLMHKSMWAADKNGHFSNVKKNMNSEKPLKIIKKISSIFNH